MIPSKYVLGEEGLRRVRKKKGNAEVGRVEVMKSERGRHNKAETGINRCRHIIIERGGRKGNDVIH